MTKPILLACAGCLCAAWIINPVAHAATGGGLEPTPAVVNPALRSPLRATLSLDGAWDFAIDPKLEGEGQEWFQPGKAWPAARKLQVPGCWEAQGIGEPGLSHAGRGRADAIVYEPVNVKMQATYTGAAWYRKEVTIPADWSGKQIWLKIGGVNAQGWFWVNGTYVGREWTYCGTYKYNITDLVRPGQRAVFAVMARNDVPSRRGESNCIRVYGGVFRSVELDATPGILIDNAFVEPLLDQKKARVHVTVRNTTGRAGEEPCEVGLDIRTVEGEHKAGKVSEPVTLGAATTTDFAWDVDLDPCHPWSPEDPFLYRTDITLKQRGRTIDGWVERFGMKKYEVRGGDLRLNNHRYFLRGGGDDHVYPLTVCSPADREQHAAHLRVAKAYGFNYVRHHTHCEIPEFYEAADEVGMMIQPELPYYGSYAKHMSGAPVIPKDDLRELIGHYRRYTSLAIYCGGNEQSSPMPLSRELFKLAKSLDPSRPWLNLDGGQNNTRENSEMNHGGYGWQYARTKEVSWPYVKHEYMSWGINEDPRLEPKHTGSYAPNQRLQEVKTFVTDQVGLDWAWADACFDAGHRLQAIWHKIGIEAARIDPNLDGFSCWLMIDISPSSQCGVLDMFWGKKSSTPEYFQQFNAPTVILAQTTNPSAPEPLGLNPGMLIYTAGDTPEVDWVVSHFQSRPLNNATLAWRLAAGERTLAAGQVGNVVMAAGGVAVVGRSRIEIPALPKAAHAKLIVEIPEAGARNSWDVWIYPKFSPNATGGQGVAASAEAWNMLFKRYPAIGKLASPEAANASVVVARSVADKGVLDALASGRRVVCLSLPGYNTLQPGTKLGVWAPNPVSNQAGTAIADHAAWGDFPHERHLDQGWFRLVDRAEKLDPGHPFRAAEPLMIGIGRNTRYAFGMLGCPLGFNLYAFQANVGKGKLLATGLDLTTTYPEATYLLDQFIRYASSARFQPKGSLDLAVLRQHIKSVTSAYQDLNGWSATVQATETTDWHSFARTGPMYIVRQIDGSSTLTWKTRAWEPAADQRVHFRWIANLGWQSQPGGGHFSLHLGNEKLLDFDITLKTTTWKSADGSVELQYKVKTLDRNEDSSGVMELSLPAAKLPPGGQPIELRVTGSPHGSRRYFGLQEPP